MGMTFPTGVPAKKEAPKKVPPTTQATLPVPMATLDLEAARRQIAAYKEEIARIQTLADELVVDDEITAKKAVEIGSHAKKFVKELEATRKAIINEPYTFVQKVNASTKPFKEAGEAIERTCKTKHGAYLYKKDLERREQEKKAQDEAKKLQEKLDKEAADKGLEPVTIPTLVVNQEGPVMTRTEDGASGSIRKVWKLKEVADFSQVPDQYKEINEKAVNAAIKAGVREIPGLVIEEVPVSVFRG